MFDMIRCTEKTERWPNALVDVSPDELDEFLDHAESCQYHAAMMRAEEEECHSVFRSARGFNSHGRVLEGTELESAIREYRRQQAVWQNSARQMEVPFKHISISNCGEEIASCGKFFAFRKHEGIHELEPEAGLQIWGVIGERGTEKILLGFYSLVHVQHKGEESLLPLENGYTVGILVEQKSERSFKIEFRCVENEVLQDELARLKPQSKRQSKVAKAANVGKSFRISVIDGIKSVFRPLTPLTQTYTGLAVKSLATFLIVFCCV
jgi:hypothetical protein